MIWLWATAATTKVAHARRVLPSIVIVVELMREGDIKGITLIKGCLERVTDRLLYNVRYGKEWNCCSDGEKKRRVREEGKNGEIRVG